MDPEQKQKPSKRFSPLGIDVGRLLDDCFSIPITAEEERARQKSFAKELLQEARGEEESELE